MSFSGSAIPSLIVPYGPRALLSLGGIVLIVGGVWRTDRRWDEEGSQAYHRAAKKKKQGDVVVVPQDELDAAFPFPLAFLLGWGCFGASYFFPISGSSKPTERTPTTLIRAATSLALGWIASVPMGGAVKNRDNKRKQKLGMLFVGSWLTLATVSDANTTKVHTGLRFAGAASIVASMKILWKYRKMGDTWEQEGKPNPKPVVYNAGGPLFVWGWFLFWLGIAADNNDTTAKRGVPFYATTRSLVAFFAGTGMVPVVMLLDYAHDHGAEWLGGIGTDGRFFGRFWESPIPFLASWTAFGLSSWIKQPSHNDTKSNISPLEYVVAANCVLQGWVAGIKIQTALYRGDLKAKTRWSLPFVGLFGALATEIGMGNGWYGLSVPGAACIILGQKTVFGDRKRGDYWMENDKKENPNPIVYSWGEPLFMAGWILISTAIAIPFKSAKA